MPAILNSAFSRRHFLRTTALGAAALTFGLRTSAEEQKTFRVALLSDTHIPADPGEAYRGFTPVANLKRITPEVVEWKPELVILNGDAARLDGKLEDYQALEKLLHPITSVAPICVSMGNHDDRANFNKIFKSSAGKNQEVKGKHVTLIEHPLLRIIVLDSLMYVNKAAGQLGKIQRTWLSQTLPKLADRPAVLFLHHTLEDNDGDLTDALQLFSILEGNRHVKALFYGHSHVWNIRERNGLKLINLPAIGYSFRDQDPLGWMEGNFTANGVELTMRAFASNTDENGKKFAVKWG